MSLVFLTSGLSLGGETQPTDIPNDPLGDLRGYEHVGIPSYEQPPSLMESEYFRENIDYGSASLFVDDPWRGTVWEGYCLKKAALHSSRLHGGQFLEGLRGLLEFPQSLLGLANRIFPQASVRPPSLSRAVSDSVFERQTNSPRADLPIFLAPVLPSNSEPPGRPLPATPADSSDARSPDLTEAAPLAGVVEEPMTATTTDTPNSAIGETPRQPESARDIQPKLPSLQWLKNIFPKTKSSEVEAAGRTPNSATTEVLKQPKSIPDVRRTSPSPQLPRNTLPRTESSEAEATRKTSNFPTSDPLEWRKNAPDIQPTSPSLQLPKNSLPKTKPPGYGEWLPSHRNDGIVIQEGTFLIRSW